MEARLTGQEHYLTLIEEISLKASRNNRYHAKGYLERPNGSVFPSTMVMGCGDNRRDLAYMYVLRKSKQVRGSVMPLEK